MRHNYKIRVDEPGPSEEKMAQHKSFDGLLADYHNLTQPVYRKPLYKNPKAFAGLIFILALVWMVFEAVNEEDKQLAKQNLPAAIRDAEKNAFLEPLNENLTVAATPFTLSDTEEQQEIKLPSGAVVKIPPRAFVDHDGHLIPSQAKIQVHIREIQSPVEMLVAGIPMQAQSGKNTVQLESIAMFDIQAEMDGQPVQLAQDIALSIQLPTTMKVPVPGTALFRLDTAERSWQSMPPSFSTRKLELPRRELSTHVPNSGFEVVEFEPDITGHEQDDSPSTTTPPQYSYQRTVLMEKLGLLSLVVPMPSAAPAKTSVRFTDSEGKPFPIYTLYKFRPGVNTVSYFWPRDKDFTFELTYQPGAEERIFAFTPKGQLAQLPVATLQQLEPGEAVQTLALEVQKQPAKNISELKQLLFPANGQ